MSSAASQPRATLGQNCVQPRAPL